MCRREENEAVERVRQMERCFDTLLAGAKLNPPVIDRALFQQLLDYYDGGAWLRDYELDEQGCFSPELKRGILSEDGVFNFLAEIGASSLWRDADSAGEEWSPELPCSIMD